MRLRLPCVRPFIKERNDDPELPWPTIHLTTDHLSDYEVPTVDGGSDG